MTRFSAGIGCSWRRLLFLLIGFHCVAVAMTAGCRQGLDYGDDVELTLNCISTRPSVTYERLDFPNPAAEFEFAPLLYIYDTIIRYTCTHPNGSVLIDNEQFGSSAVRLTTNFEHMVDPGTNCTFSGCYDPRMSTVNQLAIREVYCITDSADECLEAEHNNCSLENAVCINTVGSYECHCTDGYEGNGSHCENIDECSRGVHNCSENAKCTDSDGGFSCDCEEGYEGNGFSCTDINECNNERAAEHNCSSKAHCVNMDGGFECVCREGHEGNGFNCTEVIMNPTTVAATVGLTATAGGSSSSDDDDGGGVEPLRESILLHKVFAPLAAVLLVLSGVVVCVLVSTFVIKSRRKPKILTVYDEISRNDKLDDNYFPPDFDIHTPVIQLCQSQISILDILERTLDPVTSESDQGAQNEQLRWITHCKIDTNYHNKLSTKTLESHRDANERSSCSDDDSLSIVVVDSCSTQLTESDQNTTEQCTTPQQPQSLQDCDQSQCDLVGVNSNDITHIARYDEPYSPSLSARVQEGDTDPSLPQRKDCSSPIYLEQISRDNSNNLHYYTDSEGYILFNDSGCAVHPSSHHPDTSTECDDHNIISQEDITY